MREALTRTTADRFAWFWMVAEPIAHVMVMVMIRTVAMKAQLITGAEFVPWMITGLLAFFLFREGLLRSLGAINANKGLFAYRQVKPVDPVLVRCFLEGTLKTFIFLLFIAGGALLGMDIIPQDPLGVIANWVLIWLLGVGAGLLVSAGDSLVPEIGRLVRIAMLPLLIISGVLFPLNFLPHDILEYLLYNPIIHGIESLRLSFFAGYRPLNGISVIYLWLCALSLIALGLMLHIRYEKRLKAQ
jgi:capsular polysaccharide transport system permease protein